MRVKMNEKSASSPDPTAPATWNQPGLRCMIPGFGFRVPELKSRVSDQSEKAAPTSSLPPPVPTHSLVSTRLITL